MITNYSLVKDAIKLGAIALGTTTRHALKKPHF
jgi:hypothetical protein